MGYAHKFISFYMLYYFFLFSCQFNHSCNSPCHRNPGDSFSDGSSFFKIRVCGSFCEQIFNACADDVCQGEHNHSIPIHIALSNPPRKDSSTKIHSKSVAIKIRYLMFHAIGYPDAISCCNQAFEGTVVAQPEGEMCYNTGLKLTAGSSFLTMGLLTSWLLFTQ